MQNEWLARQRTMEQWYAELSAEPDLAAASLSYEYRPHAEFLASLCGRVLDVGGGAGLAAMYLPSDTEYIVIDPSSTWSEETWSEIRRTLAPKAPEPQFFIGTCEELPFPNDSFDAALAFWSLNHCADPERCILEIHRVLKRNGKALLVLEDMEPTWIDVVRLAAQESGLLKEKTDEAPLHWHQEDIATARATISHKLSGGPWPLQDDHVRIECGQLHRWFAGRLRRVRRAWKDGFLCYELSKIG